MKENGQRPEEREYALYETVSGILFTGQEAGLGQAPLLVGILLVLMAVVLASLIYR